MSDIQFSIGGTNAPFMEAMSQVKASASESAKKVGESFGVEGVKGERALHTRFTAAFTDITKGGTNSAEAIGGAFENLTEGLRLSLGSMIALLAVSELVKALYAGYQAASKASAGMKDFLNIKADGTAKSVDQINQQIESLKKDSDANNLAAMGNLEAGATAFVQLLEEGKSISAVVREDAEHYRAIQDEILAKQDGMASKKIEDENAVLQLKALGHDKEADALSKQQEMEERILDAKAKGEKNTVEALNEQIGLSHQIEERAEAKAQREKNDKATADQHEIDAEKLKQTRIGHDSNKDKLADAAQDTRHAASMQEVAALTYGKESEEFKKAELDHEKAITAERQVQADISKKNFDLFKKGNENDAKLHKEKLERAEQIAKLRKEESLETTKMNAAKVEASVFSGEASSSARVGLGGGVTGANFGNQSQLKATQESAAHLKEIRAAITKLSGGIGTAG